MQISPALERMLFEQPACQNFLVNLRVRDIRNRAVLIERFLNKARYELLGGPEGILPEVPQAHSGPCQEGVHAALPHQRQQRAAEHQTVEATQYRRDRHAITRYEFLQDGVLLVTQGLLAPPS